MIPRPSFLNLIRESTCSLQDLGPLLVTILNEQGGIESYGALNVQLGSLSMLISDLRPVLASFVNETYHILLTS